MGCCCWWKEWRRAQIARRKRNIGWRRRRRRRWTGLWEGEKERNKSGGKLYTSCYTCYTDILPFPSNLQLPFVGRVEGNGGRLRLHTYTLLLFHWKIKKRRSFLQLIDESGTICVFDTGVISLALLSSHILPGAQKLYWGRYKKRREPTFFFAAVFFDPQLVFFSDPIAHVNRRSALRVFTDKEDVGRRYSGPLLIGGGGIYRSKDLKNPNGFFLNSERRVIFVSSLLPFYDVYSCTFWWARNSELLFSCTLRGEEEMTFGVFFLENRFIISADLKLVQQQHKKKREGKIYIKLLYCSGRQQYSKNIRKTT